MQDDAAIVSVTSDLADEYEALIQFLYLAPVGLAQMSMDGEIVMINPISAQLLMPLSRNGGLSNLFTALEGVAPDLAYLTASFEPDHGKVCDALQIQLNAGVHGQSDPQVLSLTLLKLDANRLMAVLMDVTLQVKRERLLRHNEACFNAILTGISDYALVGLDERGCISDWNTSIGRVTGFGRDDVRGQPFSIFYPSDASTPDRVLDRLREADSNGWSLDDGWRLRADGTRFWGSAMIAPLRDRLAPLAPLDAGLAPPGDRLVPFGNGFAAPAVLHNHPLSEGLRAAGDATPAHAYCLVIRDITDKRDISESARRATACDHLTGVANRRAFFEAAELELDRWRRSPRPLALVMFDADHFKRINDNHGHPAGDAVLRALAALLIDTFRQIDVVARMGGEEFAVLLPSTGLPGAAAVADRLRRAMESHAVEVDGVPIHCTVSGGVAVMEDGLTGLDALIKRADHALYAAKAGGRNRIECWGAT